MFHAEEHQQMAKEQYGSQKEKLANIHASTNGYFMTMHATPMNQWHYVPMTQKVAMTT